MEHGLVEAAARNNAEWCDINCRLHGIGGAFDNDAWTSVERTPSHYPDAVTLRRSVEPALILDRVDASPGCSVKDTFADLDLSSCGFETLFEAPWLRLVSATHSRPPAAPKWTPVRDKATLAAWEAARATGAADFRAFPPGLLTSPAVVVLAAIEHETVLAGTVRYLGAGVASLANLFATGLDLAVAFSGARGAAARLHPGIPLVGYVTGDYLDAAMEAGLERVGGMAVWIKN